MVTPESRATESRKPAIFIAAEDTGTALQGDKVVVRLRSPKERDFPFFLKPGEDAGRVIEILERGAATITGTLHRGRTYFYVTPDDPASRTTSSSPTRNLRGSSRPQWSATRWLSA